MTFCQESADTLLVKLQVEGGSITDLVSQVGRPVFYEDQVVGEVIAVCTEYKVTEFRLTSDSFKTRTKLGAKILDGVLRWKDTKKGLILR